MTRKREIGAEARYCALFHGERTVSRGRRAIGVTPPLVRAGTPIQEAPEVTVRPDANGSPTPIIVPADVASARPACHCHRDPATRGQEIDPRAYSNAWSRL